MHLHKTFHHHLIYAQFGVMRSGNSWKAEKSFIQWPEAHLWTTDRTHILYFVVLWGPRSHSSKLRVWPWQNNDLWIISFFCHAQMCLRYAYNAHVSVFLISWIANTLRSQCRSDIFLLRSQNRSTFIRIYDQRCYCHRRLFASAHETAATI